MGVEYDQIIKFPDILRARLHIIKSRHLFLKHLGKNQYNPKQENFVSLQSLVCGVDAKFCDLIAKVPLSLYSHFQKTL